MNSWYKNSYNQRTNARFNTEEIMHKGKKLVSFALIEYSSNG